MPESHIHSIGPLELESKQVLPQCEVAYVCYGKLNAQANNAILVTHGYTASHHLLAQTSLVAEGPWAGLLAAGQAFDPDRYFVICPNMLGSCYGSTGPGSLNPLTGQVYGADFPDISMADIVASQYRLLQQLGVRHLRAVAGPSLGGFQALQWGVDHPELVDVVAAIVSAPYLPRSAAMSLPALLRTLQADPSWPAVNTPSMQRTLYQLRLQTLHAYGMDAVLAQHTASEHETAERLARMARTWSAQFNAHSLVTLLKAALRFDLRARLPSLRADVLHVVADSDAIFPAQIVQSSTWATPRVLRQQVLSTPLGHSCSGPLSSQWGPALAALIESHQRF